MTQPVFSTPMPTPVDDYIKRIKNQIEPLLDLVQADYIKHANLTLAGHIAAYKRVLRILEEQR